MPRTCNPPRALFQASCRGRNRTPAVRSASARSSGKGRATAFRIFNRRTVDFDSTGAMTKASFTLCRQDRAITRNASSTATTELGFSENILTNKFRHPLEHRAHALALGAWLRESHWLRESRGFFRRTKDRCKRGCRLAGTSEAFAVRALRPRLLRPNDTIRTWIEIHDEPDARLNTTPIGFFPPESLKTR